MLMLPALIALALANTPATAGICDGPERRSDDQVAQASENTQYRQGNITDEAAAVEFLKKYEEDASKQCNDVVVAEWKHASNLTDENQKALVQAKLKHAEFSKQMWEKAVSFAWKNFSDPMVRRQMKSLSVLGSAALDKDKLNKYENLLSDMETVYSKAKICEYLTTNKTENSTRKCNLSLEPELSKLMAKSENYDELLHVWKEWRNAAGKPNRAKFIEFVQLSNEAAKLNGFKDTAAYWLHTYEDDHIQDELEKMWQQVRPLYQQLHAYIRRKLIQKYGEDKIAADGPIPAHVLGNMWAQSWEKLYNKTIPFPGKVNVDVTETMVEQKYTALKMFQMSEEFFVSLGLEPMPKEFWEQSIIEKPQDREIVCHASAWDFCNKKDYRIKQCTDITMEFFETTHHEMGHIQYDLLYKDQPIVFREGANPGFHEAVGDLMSLSVQTPKHLRQIGLLNTEQDDKEADVNFLYSRALHKIAFLPFGYLMDQWRWRVFSGEFKTEELNKKWWELRLKYQGVKPPVPRSEEDFDAAAKYHISANVEYLRYYIAAILQFQFHKSVCDVAGHQGPLHRCDIFKSKEAGARLREALKLGSSKPWPEVLSIMTGGKTNKMDAGPMMEYFQPLYDWLKEANKNETIGWKTE